MQSLDQCRDLSVEELQKEISKRRESLSACADLLLSQIVSDEIEHLKGMIATKTGVNQLPVNSLIDFDRAMEIVW